MPKIQRTSRYYDGELSQVYNQDTKKYDINVYRVFPENIEVSYLNYTWKFGDSLANLGYKYQNIPQYWWKLMEINPEITDPFSIIPGQVIRLPYADK